MYRSNIVTSMQTRPYILKALGALLLLAFMGTMLTGGKTAQAQLLSWKPAIYYNFPTLQTFSPGSGKPGTLVTLNGQNFLHNYEDLTNYPRSITYWPSDWKLYFGQPNGVSLAVTYSILSATQVQATIPVGATTGRFFIKWGTLVVGSYNTDFVVWAALRLTNNSQYDLMGLTINGQQQLPSNMTLPIGHTMDIFLPAGTANVQANLGFLVTDTYGQTVKHIVWTTNVITVTMPSTGVVSQSIAAITIGQLLTGAAASHDWTAGRLQADGWHTFTLRVFLNGQWTLFNNGVAVDQGTATLVSWMNNSQYVTFNLKPGDPNITFSEPFAFFQEPTLVVTFSR